MNNDFNWVNRVKKEILICPECKGSGELIFINRKGSKYKCCPSCGGAGRLIKTIAYEAYEKSST